MPASEVFADGVLAGRVVLVTGGGTASAAPPRPSCAAAAPRSWCAGAAPTCSPPRPLISDLTAVAGDVRDDADAERIVRAALERHGRLDALVNNAGGQYFTPAEAIEPKGWRAVTGLNVGGTERMSRLAAELAFRPAGGGTIVNVTLSPHHGFPGMAHSSAARAAVEGYTRALAEEWASDGIAVVAVAAGIFETAALAKYPEPVRRAAARSIPLGRLGREEEHAWLVALCCTGVGASLSGSVLTLDGARDNWFGPWPPPAFVDETGDVPAEARGPKPPGS